MSLTLSTVQTLNAMVNQDTALYERLCHALDEAEFTHILVTAALANGLAADGEALGEVISKLIDFCSESGAL